ncbi:MAG TPA: hypothetical protein VLV49_16985 [Terriglobales bacterium]|nr:hypothetical protein [Terriglobales bacterium]
MKAIRRFTAPGIAALFLAAILPAAAQNQPTTPSEPVRGTQNRQPAQAPMQTFAGKIVRSRNILMLENMTSKAAYKLDHEAQLKRYVGEQVKVTGTLDAANNIIHVSDIELSPPDFKD